MKIRALMIAQVKKANATVLELRRREYFRRHTMCRTLRDASEEQKRLIERAKAELETMTHPILEAYTLHPIGWSSKLRPETKEQAGKWVAAVRRGFLPLGAYIFTRSGSDLLTTGSRVGILFTE